MISSEFRTNTVKFLPLINPPFSSRIFFRRRNTQLNVTHSKKKHRVVNKRGQGESTKASPIFELPIPYCQIMHWNPTHLV